ncbi:MAG: 5-oxoprolinase subunit PxpA [Maribacter sp.]|nr:5-oxoprolinase subunit PxpA [Maribacter sp.]NNK75719.1 5-oxoprolinase subunit PxpA [Maribacter sp.]
MKGIFIDINCDVGEGIGNEAELLPLISSCNIACGGHAGDDFSMTQVVKLAKQHGVHIGAHPSYPDKENFGRVSVEIGATELINSIQAQINALQSILNKEQVRLHHIKPHGALYNDLAKDEALAESFLKAIASFKDTTFLYVAPNSVIAKKAVQNGFKVKLEAFADRGYNEDLSLVSRTLPNAVLNDPKIVLDHLTMMVKDNKVLTVNGKESDIAADTYCLHGDTPNALQIIMYLSQELPKQQIYIQK